MAKFRQVHVSFWQDGFILTLPPEEKYFYLYLLTNSKTTQCGIYELPLRVIEMETGYSSDKIFELIHKFVGYKRILYNEETREVMLLNWLKHNSLKSSKIVTCVLKELNEVKHIPYIEEFCRLCKQYRYPIDTVSILHAKGCQTGLDGYGEEQEKEKEKEKEQEAVNGSRFNPYRVYEQEGFGVISPITKDEIDDIVETYGERWYVEAIKIAVKENKRKLSYVLGILKRWAADGIDEPWNRGKVVNLQDPEEIKRRRKEAMQAQYEDYEPRPELWST